MTSKFFRCFTLGCLGGVTVLAGCSSGTNEQVVIPENRKKLSKNQEDYQDVRERLGLDENFELTPSKN